MNVAGSPLSPEKWARIRQIYDIVLTEPSDLQMQAALRLCDGDSQLESQMKSLLSAHDRMGSFLREPAVVAFNYSDAPISAQVLERGTVLAARFMIQRLLNSGGMGRVYEAWDSELQEIVALKTIRPEIASEPAVIERFKEEVRQARQIAHPNICRVYDLFNHDEPACERIWFLTMQLLGGRTLLDHLREVGPFSRKEALPLIEQMVSGLAAAHKLGVVHRDFKSANVMLVPGEQGVFRAMITDFGLAVHVTSDPRGATTHSGQGTPAYAAPEQWRDGIVSPAADQYALGVVICEMLTGKRPGKPDLEATPPAPAKLPDSKRLNPRWQKVLARCLAIHPQHRFASVVAVLDALDPQRRRRPIVRTLAIGLGIPLVAAAMVLVAHQLNQTPTLEDVQQITPSTSYSNNPSISADGKTIAYESDRSEPGNLDIWVQHLPHGQPIRITTDPAIDDESALSPDGQSVVFESTRRPNGLYLAHVAGGAVKLLVPEGHEPKFSPDGRSIVYFIGDDITVGAQRRLFWLDLATGQARPIGAEIEHASQPVWNSDSHQILFMGCGAQTGSYPACIDWWVADTRGGPARSVRAATHLPQYGISGALSFASWQKDRVIFTAYQFDPNAESMNLCVIQLDPDDLHLKGPPKPLFIADSRERIAYSAVAANQIVFSQVIAAMNLWRIRVADASQTSVISKITFDPVYDQTPSVSRSGRWLAFVRGSQKDRAIYLLDTNSSQEKEIPLPGEFKLSPVIDDSAKIIVYEVTENNLPGIWVSRDGGNPQRLCANCRSPHGWLQQPYTVLYSDAAYSEIYAGDLGTGRTRKILSAPPGRIRDAVWSAENQYILFTVADATSRGRVYAARFPAGATAPSEPWIPITPAAEFNRRARWSGDGKTIYYLSDRDNFACIWAQRFDPSKGLIVGAPYAVQHFHDAKNSPDQVVDRMFNLAASGNSIYLNRTDLAGTLWSGRLAHRSIFSLLR